MHREERPYEKERNSRKDAVEIDISCPDEYVRQNNSFPQPEKTAVSPREVKSIYTE